MELAGADTLIPIHQILTDRSILARLHFLAGAVVALAVIANITRRACARVVPLPVDALPSILTGTWGALVDVDFAVNAFEPWQALAGETRQPANAKGIVRAGFAGTVVKD